VVGGTRAGISCGALAAGGTWAGDTQGWFPALGASTPARLGEVKASPTFFSSLQLSASHDDSEGEKPFPKGFHRALWRTP
jgi:hypothetical protein